ncbi:hypothetical protein GXP70_02685 [Paenibacillus lycopersici]|uniref:Uncharacterized protein n=1 Tax=Paenibacillus lycopersici TaxID=2704462 RepID=A0A6C0FSC0_9BACL|nr:hypothetical protein [Paenibacillus lycopersici]QHT58972.1 hypothetical protein GXP70_02685 [Paenibacillus lycopersici]
MTRFTVFAGWIIILLIELFAFYGTIHQVHDSEDVVFHIVLIASTLVVGTVATIVTKNRRLE